MLRAGENPPPQLTAPVSDDSLIEIGRTGPLFRGPAFTVGPVQDLEPFIRQIMAMQVQFQNLQSEDYREWSGLHFRKIYADLHSIMEQIQNIFARGQFLSERWAEIAPFTWQLRNDTVSFAREVIGTFSRHGEEMNALKSKLSDLEAKMLALPDRIARSGVPVETAVSEASRSVQDLRKGLAGLNATVNEILQFDIGKLAQRTELTASTSAKCVSLTENFLQQYEVLQSEVGEFRSMLQRANLHEFDPQWGTELQNWSLRIMISLKIWGDWQQLFRRNCSKLITIRNLPGRLDQ